MTRNGHSSPLPLMEHRTVKCLRQVKLPQMATWYESWRQDPFNLDKSHDQFVEEFCAVLEQTVEQGRIGRLLLRAHLPRSVCKESVEVGRGISRAQLENLFTGSWMERGHNLVLLGPMGAGKTFLAGALARDVVRRTPRVNWLDLQRLPLETWHITEAKTMQRISPYRTAKLLVLDGFAESYIPAAAGLVLKHVLDARAERQLSTIIISNRAVAEWDTAFKDAKMANELFESIFRKFIVFDLEERHPQPKRRSVRSHRTGEARSRPKKNLGSGPRTGRPAPVTRQDKAPRVRDNKP
jgi:DNA replication protein DnaC